MTQDNNESLRFARSALESEIIHRREKLWKIFSWAATLLVAIIGGTVALKTDPLRVAMFTIPLKISVAVAVGAIFAYAWFWIGQNLDLEDEAKKRQLAYDEELGIASLPPMPARFGYRWALSILALGALCLFI